MQWHLIEENWLDYRDAARSAWPQLSPAQLERSNGRRDLLCESLQDTYGLSPDDADFEIERWQRGLAVLETS